MESKNSKVINKFHTKLRQAIRKYDLIHDNDKILVGISGGKDSLSLLTALSKFKNHAKQNFEIIAIHIKVKNLDYKVNISFIENFCKDNNINFIINEININFTKNQKKSTCFVCSWHRRKRLFELCKEYKCNKLALGHHLDDAIETLLMNMCFHASISSLPASLEMLNGELKLIRPLILHKNKEIIEFSSAMNFPKELKLCPHSDKTKRIELAKLIDEIEEKIKPARNNIFNSMSKIYREYIPIENGKDPIIKGLNLPHK